MSQKGQSEFTFFEFFAGGGMARAGLGPRWQCRFANDIDPKKAESYCRNWGSDHFKLSDINDLEAADLPDRPDLVWGSFPCQDLSLAGRGDGLSGARSGTFWGFWNLVRDLVSSGRRPPLIVLENVCGAITSHGGRDFKALTEALTAEGYRIGALIMDGSDFLPQSRPRLFIVGVADSVELPTSAFGPLPHPAWHSKALVQAVHSLPSSVQDAWVWWHPPVPEGSRTTLADLIEVCPQGVDWNSPEQTEYLLSMMSPVNRQKIEAAQQLNRLVVGTIYRRSRPDQDGRSVQRAEVRLDGKAGCLRTPSGGSSRQTLIFIEGKNIRTRLLSPREAARLMGLPDSYMLPIKYNDAYHLAGDGLVVPVIEHLSQHLLTPIMDNHIRTQKKEAA